MDLGEKFVLVAALSAEHYENSHLPGAINLPYEFVDEAEEILSDKNAEIVVSRKNAMWPASEEAARALAAKGYMNIRDYEEGKRGPKVTDFRMKATNSEGEILWKCRASNR